MQPTRQIAENGGFASRKQEPDPTPELEAELVAEIARLTAGEPGQSEIEKIYAECAGPVTRRKALLDISSPRITACIRRFIKSGATELTAVCMEHEVILEIAYAVRADFLRDGSVAQRKIVLPLLKAERGAPEFAPVGTPDGRPELKLSKPLHKPQTTKSDSTSTHKPAPKRPDLRARKP